MSRIDRRTSPTPVARSDGGRHDTGARRPVSPDGLLPVPDDALEMEHVHMWFGRQHVLEDVCLGFRSGEIHGLVGHNGSGKSTAIRILAGYHRPTSGSLRLSGREISLGSTARAFDLGLRFVHQDLGLVGQFDALENFGLGAGYSHRRTGTVDWSHQRRRLAIAQEMLQTDFPNDVPVARFQPVQRTFLAIARAIAPADDGGRARFVMLDEPTTALERPEAEQLFVVVRRLAQQGVGVLYVSHQLDDVLALCETVSILRDGRLVKTVRAERTSRDELVQAMLGDPPSAAAEATPTSPTTEEAPRAASVTGADHPVLTVTGLRGQRLRDVSFEVRSGECLCAIGLSGSGREELVYAVAGSIPASATHIEVDGDPVAAMSPVECHRRRIALAPGNRLPGSLVHDFTVEENISFASLPRVARGRSLVSAARERRLARRWIEALDIRPPDPRYRCRHLSGGNKQKVILAKWLATDPLLMLVDEPTAGVDVGAAKNILAVLRSLADAGKALLISTSELSDVQAIADRVLVFNQGHLVSTLDRKEGEWTEPQLVDAMSRAL
jgi:ribose transport system ATP-binding protein